MQLSEITEDTVLSVTAHARYPGAHCAFFGVAGMVPLVKNSCALMIGPAVCLYNAKLSIDLRSLTSDPRPDNLLLLMLSQEDIIFGAHEKIKQGVIEADREHQPEVLFVVTTCTQEIIGEDFDAAIEEIQSQVKARLLVVHTDNFTCEDASPGIERTFLALADLMKPAEVRPGTVNFLGLRAPGGRKAEPIRILEEKGIQALNVIPSYSTPAEIGRASEASLNIVLEHYALPLAKKMAEEFGTPYVYVERAYTPDAVEAGYEAIAQALNIDLGPEIRELKAEANRYLTEMRERFAGKSFILGVHPGRAFDLARLLVQLDMTPLLLYASRILPDDLKDIKALLDHGVDPMVMRSGNALQSDQLLSELRPDYFIGHGDRRRLARLKIRARNLLRVYYTPGFSGTRQAIQLLGRPLTGSGILYFKERWIGNEAVEIPGEGGNAHGACY